MCAGLPAERSCWFRLRVSWLVWSANRSREQLVMGCMLCFALIGLYLAYLGHNYGLISLEIVGIYRQPFTSVVLFQPLCLLDPSSR